MIAATLPAVRSTDDESVSVSAVGAGTHHIAVRGTAAVPMSYSLLGMLNGLSSSQAPQGDWVGSFGGDGYVVGAWNGSAASDDLVWLPGASVTVERGEPLSVVVVDDVGGGVGGAG